MFNSGTLLDASCLNPKGIRKMIISIRKSLILAVLPFILVQPVIARQTKQTNYDFLDKKLGRMIDSANDFNDLTSRFNGQDREVVLEMCHQAQVASSYLSAMSTLVDLYKNITCQSDRAQVWRSLKRASAFYVKQLDFSARIINNDLSRAKNPAIIVAGNQLKDEMRVIKEFLESIRPD